MHRRQYKPYFFILPLALLAVGVGTWYDMQKVQGTDGGDPYYEFIYADSVDDFKLLPRDTSPVIIQSAALSVQSDGQIETTPSGIDPINLPQREVVLQVSLQDIPTSLSATLAALEAELNKWKRMNNTITEVVLDWQTDAPELDKLGILATAFREHMKKEYWSGILIRRAWLVSQPDALRQIAVDNRDIRSYIFDLAEARQGDESLSETLAALNAYGSRFMLRVAEKPADDINVLRQSAPLFRGFVISPPLPKP